MLLGYALTAVYAILLCAFLGSLYFARKEIGLAFRNRMNGASVAVALAIAVLFIAISAFFVHPVQQLYFDETIYQGIALNILHNGNSLWCQYGGAYTVPCPNSQIYHDPVEWSFYLAIAFLFFGPGAATAYNLQLLTGAVSIIIVFLLGSILLGKRGGVAAAAVFALIPELFVWSRTQAATNLGFMMFSALAFLCYIIYRRSKTEGTLMLFLSALGIAAYMRIEAMLLIPLFLLFYLFENGIGKVPKKIISAIYSQLDLNSLILIAFFLCLVPQIYYISYELSIIDYGTGTICGIASNHTFSISNFLCNSGPNAYYFLGQYNGTSYFPAYFSAVTTIIAMMGALALIARRKPGSMAIFAMMLLWILAFLLFYDFFYAGSVTFGVDVRFMLALYPPMAILAGAGIEGLADLAVFGVKKAIRARKKAQLPFFAFVVFVALICLFAVYPFVQAFGNVTMPTQSMPQEGGPLTASNFIYSNYNNIPAKCLVFSFTPDMWYELNRSAAQIGYLGSSDPNFTIFASHYSCYALDYGYWCSVPPYHGSTCKTSLSNYNLSVIVSEPSAGSGNLTLYMISNYTNK